MAPPAPSLSPDQLGSILIDTWRAGMPVESMGHLMCLQLGAVHPNLTVEQFGGVLAHLASLKVAPDAIGRFVLLQLACATQTDSTATVPTTTLSVQSDPVKVVQGPRKPQAEPLRKKITFQGKSSVSVDSKTHDAFIGLFGKARLREVLNKVAATEKPAGMVRSFQVQQALQKMLDEHVPASYPHSIRVIQGG